MQGNKQQASHDTEASQCLEGTLASPIQMGSELNSRYLLQELLGEGGMGRVYKALDLRREEVQDPSPYVAVKLLNDNVRKVTGAAIALQREAVIAQTLKHGGIAAVYDYNRDESHAYIVMELIEGYTLDQFIITDYPDGLPPARSFKLISQLIETIVFAHQKGVVHADIKPSNIKILPNGDVKVMDFGLARVMSLMNVSDNDSGGYVGSHWNYNSLGRAITPSYATQARLQGRQPVKVDDAYALACVIYLVLTGRHPYQRMPIDKALKMGIKPIRPKSLTKQQWFVLERALDSNISKESGVLSELSTVFCPAVRKAKHHSRKIAIAAVMSLFLLLVLPFVRWVNNELPVWVIRYSEEEKGASQLEQYMSDRSLPRKEALEHIYLPTLIDRWNTRWSGGDSIFGKTLVEQRTMGEMLYQDLRVAEQLTPYFSAHTLFYEGRNRLDQKYSNYLIALLTDYDTKLISYLTARQSASVPDLMTLYNDTILLTLVGGPVDIVQSDPRVNYLFRREISNDWKGGHYFALGEKLQLAKALFPEDHRFKEVSNKLSSLISTGELTELDRVNGPLLAEEEGGGGISLIHLPVFVSVVKELKVASSNKLDLNPLYRDRLIDSQQRYLSLGGDLDGWTQIVAQANLKYARELVGKGRVEEAYEFVDEVLAARLVFN